MEVGSGSEVSGLLALMVTSGFHLRLEDEVAVFTYLSPVDGSPLLDFCFEHIKGTFPRKQFLDFLDKFNLMLLNNSFDEAPLCQQTAKRSLDTILQSIEAAFYASALSEGNVITRVHTILRSDEASLWGIDDSA